MTSLPTGVDLAALVAFRRQIHAAPELSGQEGHTADQVAGFLASTGPGPIWRDIGGHGLALVYEGAQPGPTTLLRAELDAIPVAEESTAPWRSRRPGISHTCGHDGHLAILAGVAQSLAAIPPVRGQVILFFQPAEETGQGAAAAIQDSRLANLQPDRVFALHNLPGYPVGQILVRDGAFCAGSAGLTINLKGATSHAAYPEQGRSPDQALAALVTGLVTLPIPLEQKGQLAQVTVGHARLGEPAFGITPGQAVVMATLRADDDQVLLELKTSAEQLARKVAAEHDLQERCTWSEEFPVTFNNTFAVAEISAVARSLDLDCEAPDESPFRWSEDFGNLLSLGDGAMFGLGSGSHHAPLHAADFDFNEDLIPIGVAMFRGLLDLHHASSKSSPT
nr:amidohydrolase [Candidatus Krumholzibacteria bacterium]